MVQFLHSSRLIAMSAARSASSIFRCIQKSFHVCIPPCGACKSQFHRRLLALRKAPRPPHSRSHSGWVHSLHFEGFQGVYPKHCNKSRPAPPFLSLQPRNSVLSHFHGDLLAVCLSQFAGTLPSNCIPLEPAPIPIRRDATEPGSASRGSHPRRSLAARLRPAPQCSLCC